MVVQPILNGLEATLQIRRRGFKFPIVALTANSLTRDHLKCKEVGMNGFLSKPIQKERMIKRVRTLLGKMVGDQFFADTDHRIDFATVS